MIAHGVWLQTEYGLTASALGLAALGLDIRSYGKLSYAERAQEYPRSQKIAEACACLGADGILAPSARTPGANNLVFFCEQDTRIEKEIVRSHGVLHFR